MPNVNVTYADMQSAANQLRSGESQIEGDLESYYLYHAARADLLRRLDRKVEALAAYDRALSQTANAVERRYLRRRITELESGA